MPHKNGERRAEERLEEGRVEVYYWEDPVEWIDDIPDDFKYSVELLPIFAYQYYAVFCQHVMEQFKYLFKAEFLNEMLDVEQLI